MMRRHFRRSLPVATLFLVALPLSLLLGGCGREAAPAPAAAESAPRLVVIAKDYNEFIWALGAQQNVVGVDLSSTYPPEVSKVTSVGYHRALTAEGILSVKPTLILHDGNIGPPEVLEQLQKLGIPMRQFENKNDSIAGAEALIREIGAEFGKKERAEELCAKLEQDLAAARAEAVKYQEHPRVVIIHFGRASNVYLTMNGESVAGKMIEMAGGTMALQGKGMGRLTSPEVVAKADPEVILLTDYGFDRLGTEEKILELPGVAETTAARNHHLFRVEEHDLAYFGPRSGENVLALARLIHPAS